MKTEYFQTEYGGGDATSVAVDYRYIIYIILIFAYLYVIYLSYYFSFNLIIFIVDILFIL